jgi:hypothetical protein
MANEPGLKTAIQALAEEERRVLLNHPMPDELVDYQADDVSAEERERIQEHLALCPPCAQAVLDVEAFPEVQLSDRKVAAAWARFGGRRRSAMWPWSLAAALLLAVLGLTFELVLLRREAAAPRAGLQIVDLLPAGEDVQRSGGEREAVQAPVWVDRLVLVRRLMREGLLEVDA